MNDFNVCLSNVRIQIPPGKNIIVLANYRTGSTALCDILSKATGYANLDEAFHFKNQGKLFEEYRDRQEPCIVKIMSDQIPSEKYLADLFGNSIIVGIYRRDFVEQLASFALAYETAVWHVEKNQLEHDMNAPGLTDASIANHAKRLANCQTGYVHCRSFMWFEFFYEAVANDLTMSNYDKMPRSSGYDNLLERCKTVLQRMRIPLTNE
jgi:LPS sulfotransferase NodH